MPDDHLWTPWRMPYLLGESGAAADGCLFCRMADDPVQDDAHHMLHRGEHCFVTLNLYPYNNGHLMVIPYQHTGHLIALPGTTAAEMMVLAQQAEHVLETAYSPEGYNLGINQGAAAGAGIAEHLHLHIVPRWGGDTNFMTVVGETRVIPEWIDQTYARLKSIWREQFPADGAQEGTDDGA